MTELDYFVERMTPVDLPTAMSIKWLRLLQDEEQAEKILVEILYEAVQRRTYSSN